MRRRCNVLDDHNIQTLLALTIQKTNYETLFHLFCLVVLLIKSTLTFKTDIQCHTWKHRWAIGNVLATKRFLLNGQLLFTAFIYLISKIYLNLGHTNA